MTNSKSTTYPATSVASYEKRVLEGADTKPLRSVHSSSEASVLSMSIKSNRLKRRNGGENLDLVSSDSIPQHDRLWGAPLQFRQAQESAKVT